MRMKNSPFHREMSRCSKDDASSLACISFKSLKGLQETLSLQYLLPNR